MTIYLLRVSGQYVHVAHHHLNVAFDWLRANNIRPSSHESPAQAIVDTIDRAYPGGWSGLVADTARHGTGTP